MYNRRTQVLLIDDDEDDYIITRDLLDDLALANGSVGPFGFELDWVDNYDDGLEAVKQCQYDVYLIDYRLGRQNGLTLLREGLAYGCDAPYILLTGQGDREVDVEAMRAGAADYLVKGEITSSSLERSLRYAVGRKNAEERQKQLERQLRQSQKMEAIGRLAGGIAHDFNNSLTIIMTCCELLLREPPPAAEEMVEYVREIERAGEQASALTRQLLAISRKQELKPRLLNLNDLVVDLEKMLQRVLRRDIDLVTLIAADVGQIKADPGQLEQVIMNLVINARDAIPNGGGIIVETGRRYLDEHYTTQHIGIEPGEYATLIVSDSGDGIDEDVLPHIFEPFFTTKSEDKGTGLGLATVYGVVQQNGGQIRVYTEKGFGTTFKTYFPLAEEAETAESAPETPLSLSGTETILLVDDDPKILDLLSKGMRRYSYHVLDAANAAEARQLAQQYGGNIDLLVTDVVMAEVDGVKLAQQLRAKQPTLKTLFISGYTQNVLAFHGYLQERAMNFVEKPFSLNHFLSVVRTLLDQA